MTEGDARHILARFLFYGFHVYQKVGKLSGGERMRLRLAQLMHQDINLLILDEPTNHLDIDSREVLEEALSEFQGTIITVSHDRYLLNKLFHKTYWLQNGKLHAYLGNYSWAREHMIIEDKQVKQTCHSETKNKVERPVKSEEKDVSLESLERKIEDAEHRLSVILQAMERETEIEKLQLLYVEQKQLEETREGLYEKMAWLES